MNDAFLKTFDESYLRELRKSDLEIITDMLVRNIQVACILPKQQRIALANLIRDKADLLDQLD
jgi:hypothetical protein